MAAIPFGPGVFGKVKAPHIKIYQPRDVVTPLYSVTHASGKAKLTWNKSFKVVHEERYISAQEFIDSEVLRDCEPYVPFRAGILVFSGITGTKIGSGTVSWTTPYARYQYMGILYVPSPFGGPNIKTSRKLKYHGGGKRGARWFDRSKEVNKEKWIKGAAAIAARGKG